MHRTAEQLIDKIVADARRQIDQARIQRAILTGAIVWTPRERMQRLAARAALHREAGRTQAYAACKRMAQRIADSIEEARS